MTKKQIEAIRNRGGIPELKKASFNCLMEAYLLLKSLVDTPGKYHFECTIKRANEYTKMALQLEKATRKK